MTISDVLRKQLADGLHDGRLSALYSDVNAARERILSAAAGFEREFGEHRPAAVFSAPGRCEIGGNHTDHQHGAVLAAAVELDTLAVAAPSDEPTVRIYSEGFGQSVVSLSALEPAAGEEGTSAALIRGIAARLTELGYAVGGFDAYVVSGVPKGSGLSSSAAFEVLVGTIFSRLYNNGGIAPITVAQAGQYAENKYFGKPCGLMDQAASAIGGFLGIDFADPSAPVVRKISFDPADCGYALCIINAGGDHADLTPEYAAVPEEMRMVAEKMGAGVLGDVAKDEFYRRLPALRGSVPDRALMRAMHFFDETERAAEQADALERGCFERFLELVRRSGESSQMLLQNTFPCSHAEDRSICLALALSQRLLSECGGAWRVHGGGFAGTTLAFVPSGYLPEFTAQTEAVFGKWSCLQLHVRAEGGVQVI